MKITLFTTNGCPNCKSIKNLLTSKQIPFEESDDIEEVIKLGYTSAPVLKFDNNGDVEYLIGSDIIKRILKGGFDIR